MRWARLLSGRVSARGTMRRRRLSKFSPGGGGGFVRFPPPDLPPMTTSQQAHLLHAVWPEVGALPLEAYELAEFARQQFYAVRISSIEAIPHKAVQRDLADLHRGLAAVGRVLGGEDLRTAVIVRHLATFSGKRPGHLLSLLGVISALEQAAADAIESHEAGARVTDMRTPFLGWSCELLWLWRGVLGLRPAITNRGRPSAFCKFAFALMEMVPIEARMHVAGARLIDPDSWSPFTKALLRADHATREFQQKWPMARMHAWSLGVDRAG